MLQEVVTPAKVLVVEDDEAIQFMQRELLTAEGYEVVLAGSGLEALAAIERASVDAVILDMQLPDIDGITVCQRIRATDQGHLPILIASANRAHESIAEAMAAGADAYLTKPFQPDLLLEQLRILLNQPPA